MSGYPSADPRGLARFHARVLDLHPTGEAIEGRGRTAADPNEFACQGANGRVVQIGLDLFATEASALKPALLAFGGDLAMVPSPGDRTMARSAVVLTATLGQYQQLLPRLADGPPALQEVGTAIGTAITHRIRRSERIVRGLHRSFTVGGRTLVMGIVNVTPDSFSDGGRFFDPELAARQAHRLAEEGADLLDVGGESTRPGATAVSAETEWARIGPVLERLVGSISVPISVDTRHPAVAERAIEHGADLLNDVGGLREPGMRALVARSGAPVILMHMRGDPTTMRSNLVYTDLRAEVYGALSDACALAVSEGVHYDQLLIDPGLGFGKSPEQDLELLGHLSEFRSLGAPVVVGASRKSFLGWALGGAPIQARAEAGLAAAVAASQRGADIVRVHDVGPTVRALRLADRLPRLG
ncbi:MAG: dihydropteroate synthase [Thermoplasmata archaeon]|nr:dihydropteroate synthase [Thermoplasmata archaeon]MCI4359530.1 dihydropteroate synthase [Thermoplasmata archaeon]